MLDTQNLCGLNFISDVAKLTRICTVAAAMSVLLSTTCGAQERSREQALTPTTGVIKLFDGKSLDGFYAWMKDTGRADPRQVFRVTDGLLHVTGDGLGGLLTNAEYRDYHVVFEFKWGPRTWNNRKEATKDSGLLVHSVGADGGYSGTWMPSIEVQIIEGGMGDFIMVSGNDKDGKPVPF